MNKIMFAGAKIWDASGSAPFDGDVLVQDNRIAAVSRAPGQLPQSGCQVVDGSGMTLMPGLVEGHMHLSFEAVTRSEDLTLVPPEEHTLLTARQAKLMLDHGFTSCHSGASAKLRLEIAVRNEVNAGRLPGPRIRAATPEITVSGGLGDENMLHYPRPSFALIADGVDEMTKLVRICCREGVDNVKLNVSGDPFLPGCPGEATPMSQREIDAAIEVAHAFGRTVNVHARSTEAIKRSLKGGADVLYHCEYADEEALDMLEAAKDRILVAPTVSLFHTMLFEASPFGMTKEIARGMGMQRLLEWSQKTHTELRKRGIRHVIGGDYGFAWSRHGTNARDLGFFIQYFGYSPAEALKCATRNGGALMMIGRDEKLGEIKEGYLADLLLVDGDPLTDVSLLLNPDRLAVIMKNGELYKNAAGGVQRRAAA
jgi:imidazolonepropionase-like amidohydrolase